MGDLGRWGSSGHVEFPISFIFGAAAELHQRTAAQRQPSEIMTILVPRRWWRNALHTQTAVMLRRALPLKRGLSSRASPIRWTERS
jgi:hypothetical protein